jgi:murein L,D-transpeptidase YafK
MTYLIPVLTCLLGVLVIGMPCHQRTIGKEPHAERGANKKESDSPVQEKENLKLPLKEPRIVVFKSKRQLELYSNGVVVRTYRVGLGLNPVSDKQREGDRATPEGEFYILPGIRRALTTCLWALVTPISKTHSGACAQG